MTRDEKTVYQIMGMPREKRIAYLEKYRRHVGERTVLGKLLYKTHVADVAAKMKSEKRK